MTLKFNNVYVGEASTVGGPMESKSPYKNYFDKLHDSYYIDKKSLEKSEGILAKESIDILLNKSKLKLDDINLIIGGDLQNQIMASSYASNKFNKAFLGVYSACATSIEEIIIGSSLIESNNLNNIICVTSSHNLAQEKQFRNPIEYGAPKAKTCGFTVTGGASILLTNNKTSIKVSSGTIGKIVDLNQTNVNNMGAVMAPAAADTIYNHLQSLDESVNDYDLILTGDLGMYGKEILKDYMKEEYNITLNNYNDCGFLIYDLEKTKNKISGGSGPVCSALINYSYIYNLLKTKKLKKVLLVATGALFSPNYVFQRNNLLGIAHAICLEAI